MIRQKTLNPEIKYLIYENDSSLKIKYYLKIFIKSIFYLINQITHFYMLKLLFDRIGAPQESLNTQERFMDMDLSNLMVFIIIVCLMICERYHTYRLTKEIYQKSQNLEKLDFEQKFSQIVISLFYLDYFILQTLSEDMKKYIRTSIMKKSIIRLYCEDMNFCLLSQFMYMNSIINDIKYSLFDQVMMYTAFSTSLFYLIYRSHQSFLQRIYQQSRLLSKEELEFKKLQLQTQLFITSPFQLGYIKQNSHTIENYPELFRNQVNQSFEKPLVWYKNLLMLFIVTFHFFLVSNILILSSLTKFFIDYIALFVGGFILYSPQIFYFLYLTSAQGPKIFLKNCLKTLITAPYLSILGIIIFFYPIKIEIPAIIKELKENWMINVIPSGFIIMVKQILSIFYLWAIGKVIYAPEQNEWIVNINEKAIERVKQSEEVKFAYVGASFIFIVFTLQNIFYFIYYLYNQEKNSQKKLMESKIKKQNTYIDKDSISDLDHNNNNEENSNVKSYSKFSLKKEDDIIREQICRQKTQITSIRNKKLSITNDNVQNNTTNKQFVQSPASSLIHIKDTGYFDFQQLSGKKTALKETQEDSIYNIPSKEIPVKQEIVISPTGMSSKPQFQSNNTMLNNTTTQQSNYNNHSSSRNTNFEENQNFFISNKKKSKIEINPLQNQQLNHIQNQNQNYDDNNNDLEEMPAMQESIKPVQDVLLSQKVAKAGQKKQKQQQFY